jgi:hypothetical protein
MKDNKKVIENNVASPELHQALLNIGFDYKIHGGDYYYYSFGPFKTSSGEDSAIGLFQDDECQDIRTFESVLAIFGKVIFSSHVDKETRKMYDLLSQDLMSHYQTLLDLKLPKASNN